MKNFNGSKRMQETLTVIDNLWYMLSQNTMAQICGLSPSQVDQICTVAIQQTAKQFGVTDSTIYSKCVREIGFDNKVDFTMAVVKQMSNTGDDLYFALVRNMTSADSVWAIESNLDLPFNYGY